MTVEAVSNKQLFHGGGSTGPFSFPMTFDADAEIVATRITLADDSEAVLTQGVDYTLTGAGSADGGELTLTVALGDGTEDLLVERVLPLSQTTDLANGAAFYPEVIERAIDRTVKMVQQINDALARAPKLPSRTEESAPVFPESAPGKLVGWDEAGNLAALDRPADGEPGGPGPAGAGIYIGSGSAPPVAGDYVRGDRWRNTEPSGGGNLEWVCVADGNPGTWLPAGTISLE